MQVNSRSLFPLRLCLFGYSKLGKPCVLSNIKLFVFVAGALLS